jgi:hypothetical protein
MMPPFATAATKAADVQLAAVPVPTTVVGLETSTGSASAGMVQLPATDPGLVVPPDAEPPLLAVPELAPPTVELPPETMELLPPDPFWPPLPPAAELSPSELLPSQAISKPAPDITAQRTVREIVRM